MKESIKVGSIVIITFNGIEETFKVDKLGKKYVYYRSAIYGSDGYFYALKETPLVLHRCR